MQAFYTWKSSKEREALIQATSAQIAEDLQARREVAEKSDIRYNALVIRRANLVEGSTSDTAIIVGMC